MPAPTFHTERLTIRPMRLDDAADLAERRSDPDTADFQAWTLPYSLERAVTIIDEMNARGEPQTGEWFQFALERTSDGVVVGDVALRLDADGHNGEVGYALHPSERGKGYATEASVAIIDYGFTHWNLHRFEAIIDPRNAASAAVLGRLGFRDEGTSTESFWLGDVVADRARFGLLRREWEQRRA